MKTPKCGNCKHAHIEPSNIKILTCKGAPPQVAIVPTGPGQVQVRQFWPSVSHNDEPCGAYVPRITIFDSGTGKDIDTPEGNA